MKEFWISLLIVSVISIPIIGMIGIADMVIENKNKQLCKDYTKLYPSVKTEWVSTYDTCIDTKTRKRINTKKELNYESH